MIKKFDEVFVDKTRLGKKIPKEEYKKKGKYIIIDQGKDKIAGFTDNEDGIFTDVPTIIFGDHTRIIKYIDKPFFLGADGVKVLKSKINNANYKYLYYALKAAYIPNTGYNRHFKWLKKVSINYPSFEKQKRIVKLLDNLSEVKNKKNEELKLCDTLIKARFVEMFGDPMIKKDDRNLRKLKEICIINPKKNLASKFSNDIEVSFVPMSSVSEQGDIDVSQRKNYSEVRKGFTYFAENDVLFAKITPCMENGKGAIATGLINGIGFGSTEFHILRPIKNITNPYWIYVLTSFKSFRKLAEVNMTGSAGQRRVPATFLKDYEVRLPPIELQNEFASFVQQVDKSKVAIQKSLDETQILFDSLMQKYFS